MRTILITGCSSGIGLHCALRLKEEGWKVFPTARRKKDLEMLKSKGFQAVHLDYEDENSIHSAFNRVMKQTDGKLDALFNNGAFGQPGAVEDLTTDILRQQFEANFFGWHTLTNLCVPVMRKQGHGRIIQCSSVLGWIPFRWRGAYNSSKFALEGLALTMRLELIESGIHLCLIEPGPIDTDFGKNALTKLKQNIDMENSVHSKTYKKRLAALEAEANSGANRFRLGSEAVYKKLDHALNSDKPRAHYPVTIPTHFMNLARRVFPQFLLDRVLLKSG